jgi:outer membrane immunogenic protein
VAAAAISVPALAADLGVYEPVPTYEPTYTESFNWTGAYLGGHIGWAWDDADFTLDDDGFWGDAGASTSIDSDGFIGGGQVGFWYQPNNFVFGVDVSGSWADLSGSATSPEFASDTWSTEIDWFLLAQARAGIASGRWLAFLQGGYAGADGNAGASLPGCCAPSDSNWHNGWTVGGGVAFKAHRWLSLGVEYNYVDLGSESYSLGGGQSASVDHQIHVVKGTINFHFNRN